MNRQNKALAFGLATVLIWSTVASAFKLALRYLTPMALLFLSIATSVIVLFFIVLIQGRLRDLFSVTRKDVLLSLGLGTLNPFLYYLVLFTAYDRLPAQEAQPLNYTWAITLSLLSAPLLKQKITWRQILGLCVSYLGVVIIALRGDFAHFRFSDPLGAGLALGSTFIWALYWIGNTKDTMAPAPRLFLNFVVGFILTSVTFFFLKGTLFIPWEPGHFGAIYVGLFEMGITFVLWGTALKLSNSTATMSNLIYLSPFLSLFFINRFVGETILPSTILGLVAILAGIMIQSFRRNNKKAATP